ncbi:MAG: hypothetical protein N4A47_03930 [Clostridia bacterium]|nr:hypothetical protein [Clostridia bacterium]
MSDNDCVEKNKMIFEKLANKMIELISFEESCFNEWRTKVELPGCGKTYRIEFERTTLLVLKHNLQGEELELFMKIYKNTISQNIDKEIIKTLNEYKILRRILELGYVNENAKILKSESPDFILKSNTEKIGVEITEIITESDAVYRKAIFKLDEFNKDVDRIKSEIIDKYPKKGKGISVECIDVADEKILITSPSKGLVSINSKRDKYVEQILNKFNKYNEKFDIYDKNIILANPGDIISLTECWEFEEVADNFFKRLGTEDVEKDIQIVILADIQHNKKLFVIDTKKRDRYLI